MTVGETAAKLGLPDAFLSANENPGAWWYFDVFGFKIYCYNFEWRREALAFHDLHHVVTGYPCTMKGEMQVATWEFAAGRFPNVFSNLFCLPLVALGAATIPHKTFAAFEQGKGSQSLFGQLMPKDVATWPSQALIALTARDRTQSSRAGNMMGFAALVCLSFFELVLLATPFVLGVRALVGLL